MSSSYKLIFIFLSFLVFVFCSIFIKEFRIDASSDTLVAQNDSDFEYFNYYKDIFPSKNSLIIAIESKKIIDEKLLNEVEILTNKIKEIKEVSTVFSINKAPILFLNDTSILDLSNDNYQTILNSNFKTEQVLEEFSKSPIYSEQIINKNKNITSLIIFLKKNDKAEDLKQNKEKYILDNTYFKKKTEIDKERNKLIKKIRLLINNSNQEYKYYLGGIEMISNDVISYVKSDIILFSFIVVLLVIIILFIIFKKIKWVFVILVSSIFSVYTMIGITGYLNFEITAVSANFLSLMFILSISMHIHILNNFLQNNNSLIKTLKMMFWPCFYTFLTTVVAFLSLVISDIKPVIDFGIIMIVSLFIVLVNSFTILPLTISFFNKGKTENALKNSALQFFNFYSINFPKTIFISNIALFIISFYGATTLNVENSFIKYFKKNTEIYQGMKLIDSELGGTTPLDIIIEFEDEQLKNIDNLENKIENKSDIEDELLEDELFEDVFLSETNNIWFNYEKIETIQNIHNYLEKRKEIGKVNSIYSLIDVANQINKTELSTFELSILYNEIPDQYKEDLIFPYLNIDKNMVKISARVRDSEDIERAKLISEIKDYTNDNFKNIKNIRINGLLVLYNNMLSSLFSSQIKSLGFVLLAIFIMFIILFKSIKLSIIGIVPNILASTFILGLIGLFKIPLDIMTITIAAISIGIAVDNTIHYLYRYKINIVENKNRIESITKTNNAVGNAILTTSIAVSLGFLTLCFSNFVPTVVFGLFTSLAMIFAMVGVLITLPSIINYIK